VDCTLPQASAEISKTDSYRKEGAVYGFFAGEEAVSRVLSLFDWSMFFFHPPAFANLIPIVRPESRSRLYLCPRHPLLRKLGPPAA
jgi:hypothetical protein